jgi:predicted small lipoprotein YifL
MTKQIKFILLVSLVITLAACGRMGDLVPVEESQVDSVESTNNS